MKKIILIAAGILASALPLAAADSVDALSYLRVGAGSRAMSMGSAFTGMSGDVASGYYNPAGIASVKTLSVDMMYGVMSNDRSYNYLGVVYPLSNQVFALTVLNAGVSGIPKTVAKDGNPIENGTFASANNAAIISWAGSFDDTASAGINAKMFMSSLYNASAIGCGVDAGAKFSLRNNLDAGLAIQDIYSFVQWDTASDAKDVVPAVIKAGLAWKIVEEKLTLAGDIGKVADSNDIKYNLGAEYLIGESFAVRAGIDEGNIAAGFGVKNISMMNLDYALRFDDLDKNSNRHFITVGLNF